MRHIEKDYSDISVSLSNDKFQKHFEGIKSGKFKNISGDYYAANDVAEKLKSLYKNKCAYCETIEHEPDIEHYRPQSKYKLLAYEWSNLIPACNKCNKNKGAKFPVTEKYFGNETNAKKLNEKENPEILNPEIDFPKEHFKFNIAGEIQGITDQAEQTINICKLNRDTLIENRLSLIKSLFKSLKKVIYNFDNSVSKNKTDFKNNLIFEIKEISEKMEIEEKYSLAIWYLYEKDFNNFLTKYIPNKTQRIYVKKAYEIFKKLKQN